MVFLSLLIQHQTPQIDLHLLRQRLVVVVSVVISTLIQFADLTIIIVDFLMGQHVFLHDLNLFSRHMAIQYLLEVYSLALAQAEVKMKV